MLGLIFVLALALSLAACGGGGDDEENGGERETPVATKTAEAEGTEKPADTAEAEKTATPEKTSEPSGGGGASLGDVPVYPGAKKTAEYSGSDVPLPVPGGDLDVDQYADSKWAAYETTDSVEDVASFYKDKMAANGWEEESWFDLSFGGGAAWGTFTRDNGDSAAWVFVGGDEEQTVITIGTGSR